MLYVLLGDVVILASNAYKIKDEIIERATKMGYGADLLECLTENELFNKYPDRREPTESETILARLDYLTMLVEPAEVV